jgi:hypothetical protein
LEIWSNPKNEFPIFKEKLAHEYSFRQRSRKRISSRAGIIVIMIKNKQSILFMLVLLIGLTGFPF